MTKWQWIYLATLIATALPAALYAGDSTYTLSYENRYYVRPPGSDCWGWTAPDGTEYALMGESTGIAIIRTTDYTEYPIRVAGIPYADRAVFTIWKDIKTYKHYAYAVSESYGINSGLLILDMSTLPDSVRLVGSVPIDGANMFVSHNLSIDTTKGIAYCEGDGSRQVTILDLADPENPQYVRPWRPALGSEIHDLYADNDTIYVAEGDNGSWSIWHWPDHSAPLKLIVRISVPAAGYVHNIWPSPDRRFCVTTEETGGKTIKIWDLTDLNNIRLASQFLGSSRLAHNAIWHHNLIYVSHYESGVLIMDASDPYNPTFVGNYDTYPASNSPEFHSCWGVYPFTANRQVYGSTIEGRLVVLNLEATCPPPEAPALISPKDGTGGLVEPVALAWVDKHMPQYRLQVDDDSSFTSPLMDSVVTAPACEISGMPYYTSHYWRVQTINSCGPGGWSVTRSFARGCIVSVPGDINFDGEVTSSDIIRLVNYVFKSGTAPQPIPEAGDTDCSAAISSADIIRLVNFVFKAGTPPCDICSIL